MKIANLLSIASAFVGLALCSQPASAVLMQTQYFGTVQGQNVNIVYNNVADTVFSGQYSARINYGPGYTQHTPQFFTYCVDLDHSIGNGDLFLADITPTSIGLHRGSEIAYLYNKYGAAVNSGAKAAGLQVAIWELWADTDNSLSTGNFRLTSTGSVLTHATNYLNEAIGKSDSAYWMDASLGGQLLNHKQNLLAPSTVVVPEPGVIALLLSAPPVAFACLRRRRARR